jgi:hypothetical protein
MVIPVAVLVPINDGASCGRLLNVDYLKKKKVSKYGKIIGCLY